MSYIGGMTVYLFHANLNLAFNVVPPHRNSMGIWNLSWQKTRKEASYSILSVPSISVDILWPKKPHDDKFPWLKNIDFHKDTSCPLFVPILHSHGQLQINEAPQRGCSMFQKSSDFWNVLYPLCGASFLTLYALNCGNTSQVLWASHFWV